MEINSGRWTADIDGDFVVFLLGAEVRDPEHAGPAAGLLMAMVDMLQELVQDPTKTPAPIPAVRWCRRSDRAVPAIV